MSGPRNEGRAPLFRPPHLQPISVAYPTPASPSGRYAHESLRDRLKRQRVDPRSPGGQLSGSACVDLVPREKLLLNTGRKKAHCLGLPGKLYDRFDLVGPIVDSSALLYFKIGWALPPLDSHAETAISVQVPAGEVKVVASPTDVYKKVLCLGCGSTDPANFTATRDKSHSVCACGVVCAPIHISQHREKNCTAAEDKTTHADKPYESRTDRFDHPSLSCDEERRRREGEAAGTRVSKKAKEKHGLGWAHEHGAREAARAERQRKEMDPRDQTKGVHIQLELEKLFTNLEPIDAQIKRFCRMEADRMWRESVRHSKVCCAKSRCALRIREKGPVVIADAALSCSLSTLIEGHIGLPGVTRSALLVVADKLGALQRSKGTSCALRAVRTIVSTYLAHHDTEPIESCHCSQDSPSSSTPASVSRVPLMRADSSTSEFGDDPAESRELLQMRDRVCDVFRFIGTAFPISTRDAALGAIQDTGFRAAILLLEGSDPDVQRLNADGIIYAIIESVARRHNRFARREVPQRLLSTFADNVSHLDVVVRAVSDMLPRNQFVSSVGPDDDGLF